MAEHSGLKNRGYTAADVEDRRKAAEEFTGASLDTVSKYGFDPETASKNIENMIGTIQIPLGYAGPVRITGEYADGDFLVPLATTEGALVASISRGMSVMNDGGGVRTMVCADAMTRAPVLRVEGIEHSKRVMAWIESHRGDIDEAVASTTSHGRLSRIDMYPDGRSLFLRFAFETGDAALLAAACHDRLHEPYRSQLIPDYEPLRTTALEAGASAFVISGSGSTMLAIADGDEVARRVADALTAARPSFWLRTLPANTLGTTVEVQ